jgi:hypothetical protein
MTDLQIFAAIWPFVVLALFILFGRFLLQRDLAAFEQSQHAARKIQIEEAAE